MKTLIFQQTEEVARKLKDGEIGIYLLPYGYEINTQVNDVLQCVEYFPGIFKEIETPEEATRLSYYFCDNSGSCLALGDILSPRPKVKKYKWKTQMSSGIWVIADLPPSAEPPTEISCWEKVEGSEVEE